MTLAKKTLVVSGINIVETGVLSVFQDCLKALVPYAELHQIRVVVLAHSPEIIANIPFETHYFPKSKKSWWFRSYYEYFYFPKWIKSLQPTAWLSLQDLSPHLPGVQTAVYCHNPCMYLKTRLQDMWYGPKIVAFAWFYQWAYRVNIRSNKRVVVQQQWMRDDFRKRFQLPQCVTLRPQTQVAVQPQKVVLAPNVIHLFYPVSARMFKNVEYLVAAVQLLTADEQKGVQVHLTLTGNENAYARKLFRMAKNRPLFQWHGRMSRAQTAGFYAVMDALVYCSRLETWGLPITEAIEFDKPLLLADLPYAHETASDYPKIAWHNLNNPQELADSIRLLINGKTIIDPKPKAAPTADLADWTELFDILLDTSCL
ncbi:MAG: hypothetical protein CFE24_12340 [Flavobacterium sp. BFFFF2]|nr:MAG: hypothetical protein CFE24_12340 [Flavobacterium sp. BFFFF2]